MAQFPVWKMVFVKMWAYIGGHKMCWTITCPNCTSWAYVRHICVSLPGNWPCICQAFETEPYQINTAIRPKDYIIQKKWGKN